MKRIVNTIFLLVAIMLTTQAQEQQGYVVLQTTTGEAITLKDSDIEKITFHMDSPNKGLDHMWYIIGSDIADGTWAFDIPSGRLPLYAQNANQEILSYTGYFQGNGFKLVGEDWDEQWGCWDWGYYAKNDGASSDIRVPSPGYYTVTLNLAYDDISVQPADITPADYSSISIAGSFNGWTDTEMTRVSGTNSHNWYTTLTLTDGDEMKFKANNSWDTNWGSSDFPCGLGQSNGSNIRTQAGTYMVFFNDLTGQYRFFDAAQPVQPAYQPQTFDLQLTPGATYVDLSDDSQQRITLLGADPQIPLKVESYYQYNTYLSYNNTTISLGDYLVKDIDKDSFLSIVKSLCHNKGGEIVVTLTIEATVTVNNYPEKYVGTTNITCKLPESAYGEFLYFAGATNGWTNAEQKLASRENDGRYDGFCYVADPQNLGLAFKFQSVANSWDKVVDAGNCTRLSGDITIDQSNNFVATAGEGVYYISINTEEKSIVAQRVTAMSIIGGFNGWSDDVDMTWDAENYCYVVYNAGATSSDYGWKFRVNHLWDINLGGTTDNLYSNGENIMVNANTVRLYPTRRDNNNIYCTVE